MYVSGLLFLWMSSSNLWGFMRVHIYRAVLSLSPLDNFVTPRIEFVSHFSNCMPAHTKTLTNRANIDQFQCMVLRIPMPIIKLTIDYPNFSFLVWLSKVFVRTDSCNKCGNSHARYSVTCVTMDLATEWPEWHRSFPTLSLYGSQWSSLLEWWPASGRKTKASSLRCCLTKICPQMYVCEKQWFEKHIRFKNSLPNLIKECGS